MALQLHPSPAASGAADGRPAKRSRSESSSKLEHEPRYRHSEQLWFDDGNLFVIAESYPIPTAFKVYYGVLAKVSPVLAEYMKATNDDPLYDGCPVLTLRRVEAQWVEAMLMWIFGRMLGRGPSQQLELVSVMAYYELGVKYKIEAMRSEGLSYLVESYPLDFKDYIESRSKSPRDRRIICYPRQAFDVAAFCGRHDLLSIAATALLHCCERSLTSLHGNVRNIADKRPFEDGILPSVWVRKCVLRGYPRLIAAYNSRVELLISESLPFAADCRTQGKCKADRDELRAWLLEAEDSSGGPPSRLWSLTDELKGYQGSILCGPCLSVCKQLWVADLRNTWRYSRLEIFGISRPVLSAAEGNVTH